ncbi:MAG: recombinase RecA, partial [Halobacteriales archaeon]|nr:recombinase RecA [Halobacteriales archaeon]
PVERLDPGTFLLSGPALSGKYELLLDFFVEGFGEDDGALLVTTNEPAKDVFASIESRMGELPDAFRAVDCVTERQGSGDRYARDRVEYVSSPGDLTGLGIGLTEQLRRFAESHEGRTRVGFHSLSTLLMYTELETVFRFVHVVTGRCDAIDALAFFALDPTTHGETTVNTLKQLFDGIIEVRDGEDGTELRIVGLPEVADEWVLRT